MKTKLMTLMMVVFAIQLSAQTTGTLNLTGESKKMVLPDKATLNITISAQKSTESESFKKLNEMSMIILKRLKSEGFTESQIKLTDFSLNYVNWDAKKKPYYQSSQNLSVKFPLDKERLFNVYNKLLKDSVQGVQVNFGTECSDELIAKVKDELIASAMSDARHKANVITSAANATIGGINNISYNYTADVQPMPMYRTKTMAMDAVGESAPSAASYLSINEQQFNEEIKVTFVILSGK
ncbi:MAG: SIMPL domain-containing protein [Bacteroidales bacterium]